MQNRKKSPRRSPLAILGMGPAEWEGFAKPLLTYLTWTIALGTLSSLTRKTGRPDVALVIGIACLLLLGIALTDVLERGQRWAHQRGLSRSRRFARSVICSLSLGLVGWAILSLLQVLMCQ
jgi:4-amino-4-deoxy-L-arabinose transferase-like glycosyltransferase